MKKSILPFLILSSLSVAAWVSAEDDAGYPAPNASPSSRPSAQPSRSAQAAESDDEVIKIDTTLVQMPVKVVDANGWGVGTVKEGDFELLIDGKPAPLDGVHPNNSPFVMSLLLDVSRSVFELVYRATVPISEVVVDQLRDQDRMQVFTFGPTACPITGADVYDPTGNCNKRGEFQAGTLAGREYLKRKLRMVSLRKGSAFYDAIGAGLLETQGQSSIQNKAIVIVSDGKENKSTKYKLQGIIDALAESKTAVYIIDAKTGRGDCIDPVTRTDQCPDLQEIAQKTGGLYFALDEVMVPGGQERAMRKILDHLRNKQTFSFYMTDPETGEDLDPAVTHTVTLRPTPAFRARMPKGARLSYATSFCVSKECRAGLMKTLRGMNSDATKQLRIAQRMAQELNNVNNSFSEIARGWRFTRDAQIPAEGLYLAATGRGGLEAVSREEAISRGNLYFVIQGRDERGTAAPASVSRSDRFTNGIEQRPVAYIKAMSPGKAPSDRDFASFVELGIKRSKQAGWLSVQAVWPQSPLDPLTFQSEWIAAIASWVQIK